MAPEEIRKEMRLLYDILPKVLNWNDLFDNLNLPKVSNDERNAQLVQSVIRSEKQGYHKSGGQQQKMRY